MSENGKKKDSFFKQEKSKAVILILFELDEKMFSLIFSFRGICSQFTSTKIKKRIIPFHSSASCCAIVNRNTPSTFCNIFQCLISSLSDNEYGSSSWQCKT